MSLDSCIACGHALAIADHRCRHCSSATIATQRGIKSTAFYLLVALAALVLGLLFGADPMTASSIVLTTITDVASLAVFLGLATWMI